MLQQKWKAEVVSIGDEIISGQRLDTNTQWLSKQLSSIGIPVHYHSSVGDDLTEHVGLLKLAMERANLIIMTGGLGPTADDLTRQAIAAAAQLELEFREEESAQIESRFRYFNRPMPESNRLQAWFPTGSRPIPNPEGTAPGIDLTLKRPHQRQVRIIALPGVPAEMKQMWVETVERELRLFTGVDSIFHFHTLHCFGAGESQIEAMLPGLIERGRDPKVGITASEATISLRIATSGSTVADCQQKIEPTLTTIYQCLGDLIFGENGQTLAEVAGGLLQRKNCRLGIIDQVFDGELAAQLETPLVQLVDSKSAKPQKDFRELNSTSFDQMRPEIGIEMAEKARQASGGEYGMAILSNRLLAEVDLSSNVASFPAEMAEVPQITVVICDSDSSQQHTFSCWGHSAWRRSRAVKQVLNLLRLYLAGKR